MRIYIDESKKLDKGKIIIGGFFTYHNTSFIDTFIKNKKEIFNIPNNAELKSTKKYGKLFLENIFHDNLNLKNNKVFERKIDNILKEKFGIKSIFKIHNSRKYFGLQLADLFVGKYKEFYLFDDIKFLDKSLLYKDFKNNI